MEATTIETTICEKAGRLEWHARNCKAATNAIRFSTIDVAWLVDFKATCEAEAKALNEAGVKFHKCLGL